MNSPLRCGTANDSDFDANTQCCICGGGTQVPGGKLFTGDQLKSALRLKFSFYTKL